MHLSCVEIAVQVTLIRVTVLVCYYKVGGIPACKLHLKDVSKYV